MPYRFLPWLLYPLYAVPAFIVPFGAFSSSNPGEYLQDHFGLFALYFLLLTLSISPIRQILPKNKLLASLAKYKRGMGLACFFYACAHLSVYVLLNPHLDELAENLSKPFVQIGLLAFLVLLALALTSNNFSVRKLGGRNWKKLHRMGYLLLPLLFLHVLQNDKGDWLRAFYLLAPLSLLEIYRLMRFYLSKKRSRK